MPAAAARIDLVDRIFTRIGASDDLTRGQSTFMVEMTETANILNNATPRSLIVLDEIGRGTSTFDGLSLAWRIVEHLHNAGRRQNALCHALPRVDRTGRRVCRESRISTWPCANGTTRSFSCARLSKAARTKATASRWRGWRACRRAVVEPRQGNSRQPGGIRTDAGRQSAPAPPPPRIGETKKARPAAADGFVRLTPAPNLNLNLNPVVQQTTPPQGLRCE